MKHRQLPFGYEMVGGKVCVSQQEADTVRWIFQTYAGGASYNRLTELLNARGIPYRAGQRCWNKNMVARILANVAYTGEQNYPEILDVEQYQTARDSKASHTSAKEPNPCTREIRKLARCAVCGGKIKITTTHEGWYRWACTDCNTLKASAITPTVLKNVTHIYQALLSGTYELCESHCEAKPDKSINQAQNRLQQLLNVEEYDEEAARAAAFELAAARFDAAGTEQYETMRIRYVLEHTEQSEKLDTDLLRSIASAILIHTNGTVSIKLKNGQILERSGAS